MDSNYDSSSYSGHDQQQQLHHSRDTTGSGDILDAASDKFNNNDISKFSDKSPDYLQQYNSSTAGNGNRKGVGHHYSEALTGGSFGNIDSFDKYASGHSGNRYGSSESDRSGGGGSGDEGRAESGHGDVGRSSVGYGNGGCSSVGYGNGGRGGYGDGGCSGGVYGNESDGNGGYREDGRSEGGQRQS